MNKPKRGKASIKKPTNKKFNTLKKKDLESKRGKKKKKKNIKQKNRTQNKLGFRDTSTESSRLYQYLYIVRRGRQEGRETERLPLEMRKVVK